MGAFSAARSRIPPVTKKARQQWNGQVRGGEASGKLRGIREECEERGRTGARGRGKGGGLLLLLLFRFGVLRRLGVVLAVFDDLPKDGALHIGKRNRLITRIGAICNAYQLLGSQPTHKIVTCEWRWWTTVNHVLDRVTQEGGILLDLEILAVL